MKMIQHLTGNDDPFFSQVWTIEPLQTVDLSTRDERPQIRSFFYLFSSRKLTIPNLIVR